MKMGVDHYNLEWISDRRCVCVLLDDAIQKIKYGEVNRTEARAIVLATLSTCRDLLDSRGGNDAKAS